MCRGRQRCQGSLIDCRYDKLSALKIPVKEHCGVDVPSPKAPQAVTEVTVKPSPGPKIPFITNKTIEDLGVIKYPVLPILKKTKERFSFSDFLKSSKEGY